MTEPDRPYDPTVVAGQQQGGPEPATDDATMVVGQAHTQHDPTAVVGYHDPMAPPQVAPDPAWGAQQPGWDPQSGGWQQQAVQPYQPPQPYQQHTGELVPHQPSGGWPVPQQQAQPQPYGQPPNPYGHAPQRYVDVAPADKSVGAALVLTFLFGGPGLFYTSIIGGVIMTIADIFAFIVTVLTFGFGGVLFLLIWPATMVWAAVSASERHREFEMWRIRQFQQPQQPYYPQ